MVNSKCEKILDYNEVNQEKFIYFIKFEFASYIHSYWVNESLLEKISCRKLKNFKEKNGLIE